MGFASFYPSYKLDGATLPSSILPNCVAARASEICLQRLRQSNPTGKSILFFRNDVKPGNQK
jgi:hypothetical protein